MTPDQVKYALTSTADPLKNASSNAAGAGAINLSNAYNTANDLTGSSWSRTVAPVQAFPKSTGQGSIDAARGSGLVDANGIDLIGEVDVQGNTWNPATWWQSTSSLTAWSGGNWLGTTWTGDDWLPVVSGLTSSRWSSSPGPPRAGPPRAGRAYLH